MAAGATGGQGLHEPAEVCMASGVRNIGNVCDRHPKWRLAKTWSGALIVCALLMYEVSHVAFAQNPPLSRPNLQLITNGRVDAILKLADGSIVFGGLFDWVNGVPRSNIARLQPDGSLDPSWNPGTDGEVLALGRDTFGNVYVGGAFNTIGGQQRYCVAKLSNGSTPTIDAIWNPSSDRFGFVYSIAVDVDENVYLGGQVTSMGGIVRKHVAKVQASGAVDTQWDPSPDGSVQAVAVDTAGNVYIGGFFQNIGGQPRNNIAKVSATGAGTADSSWNPSPDFDVLAIAVDAGNSVYIAGGFSNIGGQQQSALARVQRDGAGTADASWRPQFNSAVYALALGSDGAVYAAGNFDTVGSENHPHIVRLSSSGTGNADDAWTASTSNVVLAVAIGSSGDVYAGGEFSSSGGQTRLALASMSASNGAAGPVVDAEAPGRVHAVAPQPQGGTIVAGDFVRANGVSRSNILRLQQDRALDPTWNPMADAEVDSVAIDANGDIFAGGKFESIGGQSRRSLAKLSGTGNGVVDALWNPECVGTVDSLATDAFGNIYAGGSFFAVGGQIRTNIAKLSATGNGSADALWNPSPDSPVSTIALDGSGHVYVGGYFQQIGGANRNYLAKLSANDQGNADPTWNPNPNSWVNAVAIDPTGNVFAGGAFSGIGGSSQRLLAKLSGIGSGAADANWFTYASGSYVDAVSIDHDARVYIGGIFNFNGSALHNLARLSANGAPDASWNPSPDGEIFALAPDSSNDMYVGGNFKSIGGKSVLGLALLPTDRIFFADFE